MSKINFDLLIVFYIISKQKGKNKFEDNNLSGQTTTFPLKAYIDPIQSTTKVNFSLINMTIGFLYCKLN